ncbi:hypothetical protein PHLCEN_2v5465 [Hermanssonia centrifuga]|uniref:Uncharacterized protein n=1 Tax=Hermanssonia centrifuga TaxID=98765 RepID=A0A2R6P2C4_9APHY|nr:hypothetical protein PHLCEN_2v5465 [Hermanssonia centrifuga]
MHAFGLIQIGDLPERRSEGKIGYFTNVLVDMSQPSTSSEIATEYQAEYVLWAGPWEQ